MHSKLTRAVVIAVGLSAGWAALAGPSVHAQGGRPLTAGDFEQAAPRGFGDRSNSWPQAMVWWHNHLYVGTARESACTSLFSIWNGLRLLIGNDAFVNAFFPYPPRDPELSCTPNGADLPLQAEIWRWKPGREGWTRVFQSPLALDNPGTGNPRDTMPPVGKKLPYEIAFRGMQPFTEPDGTEALYAFGVNSTVMWDRTKLPPPRILRTTDGENWTAVPQTPGTFLGTLPFNPDHSSFRSPESFAGKLFVLSGPIFGQGSLIASADPAKGDDAWFLAAPTSLVFYEMASFNGWLYLGTYDITRGYAVVKTRAEGPPPYQFVTVIPPGAFVSVNPSKSVVSMHEYHGQLYVGTATFTEIIRLNADDTWDVVVGEPRLVPLPDGTTEWKYPLSNLNAGFGHTLNDHAWQMDDMYGYQYVGTYNASLGARFDPVAGPLLAHNMGAHLYRTNTGWYYTAVTTNGFADLGDPLGGKYDYGIRTMAATPHGAFFGFTNDHYGLSIYRGKPRGSNLPDPPERLEIEPGASGAALLAWQREPRAKSYEVWRAEVNPIQIRDDINVEAWEVVFRGQPPCAWAITPELSICNKINDRYVGPYARIGTTEEEFFRDATVVPGKTYMYYVVTVANRGLVSEQSNLTTFPVLLPPMTFSRLLDQIDRWDARQRFRSDNQRNKVRGRVEDAQSFAAQCQFARAATVLNPLAKSTPVMEPEATDLEVMISKLVQRMDLFGRYPYDVVAPEFCSEAGPERNQGRNR
ncbi:MAG: hypothetical protein ABIX28_20385 [Vicinamibacterales bacterium]